MNIKISESGYQYFIVDSEGSICKIFTNKQEALSYINKHYRKNSDSKSVEELPKKNTAYSTKEGDIKYPLM
jgi:hypothetical protein